MNVLDLVRLLVGIPLVLGLPGYAWSLLLLPGRRGALERAVWAVLLSLVTVPLAAIWWSAGLGLPLGAGGSLAVVAIVAGLGFALASWRQRRALAAA